VLFARAGRSGVKPFLERQGRWGDSCRAPFTAMAGRRFAARVGGRPVGFMILPQLVCRCPTNFFFKPWAVISSASSGAAGGPQAGVRPMRALHPVFSPDRPSMAPRHRLRAIAGVTFPADDTPTVFGGQCSRSRTGRGESCRDTLHSAIPTRRAGNHF